MHQNTKLNKQVRTTLCVIHALLELTIFILRCINTDKTNAIADSIVLHRDIANAIISLALKLWAAASSKELHW